MTRTTGTFDIRAERLAAVLDAANGQWDAPTPCEGWSVRDVVAHVIDTEREFLSQHQVDLGDSPDLTDPAAAWRSHAAAVGAALTPEVRNCEYDGPFGRTTVAATMGEFYGWDLLIHGWDIARATGQRYELDDAEAAALTEDAAGWGPALYADGICKPAVDVPAGASAQDRLLAMLGRNPGWSPTPDALA